jgi:hypothetical protein
MQAMREDVDPPECLQSRGPAGPYAQHGGSVPDADGLVEQPGHGERQREDGNALGGAGDAVIVLRVRSVPQGPRGSRGSTVG